jgi:hypothetical protein
VPVCVGLPLTGLSWGYGGSGPADTARSLLIAALGADAMCHTCGGTGRLAFDPNVGEEPSAVPWDPTKPPQEYAARGLEVTRCWDWECDGGFRQLPYQAFKSEQVATWDDEFRISRTQIPRVAKPAPAPTCGQRPRSAPRTSARSWHLKVSLLGKPLPSPFAFSRQLLRVVLEITTTAVKMTH